MEVVAHEAICVDLYALPFAHSLQQGEESPTVTIAAEYQFLRDATVTDVAPLPGAVRSMLASHRPDTTQGM